ncbi:GNAT family N-acetyltransferase [Paraburkholderia sp.]|uniref:GNAT family N-acetyltransferase n=1 Tax=Paraburkholderia sp. TaxID=1926495 RepID=UPI003D6DEB78
MKRLSLAAHADLDVYYEAEMARYKTLGEHGQWMMHTVTRKRFIDFFGACPSIGFEYDGKPIGGMIFDGEEAHVAVLPEYHGRWALLWESALDWVFSLKQEIDVKVEAFNPTCIAFMERNGWPAIDRDGDFIVFRMTPRTRVRKGIARPL